VNLERRPPAARAARLRWLLSLPGILTTLVIVIVIVVVRVVLSIALKLAVVAAIAAHILCALGLPGPSAGLLPV